MVKVSAERSILPTNTRSDVCNPANVQLTQVSGSVLWVVVMGNFNWPLTFANRHQKAFEAISWLYSKGKRRRAASRLYDDG
jgi:hypothetical protein